MHGRLWIPLFMTVLERPVSRAHMDDESPFFPYTNPVIGRSFSTGILCTMRQASVQITSVSVEERSSGDHSGGPPVWEGSLIPGHFVWE